MSARPILLSVFLFVAVSIAPQSTTVQASEPGSLVIHQIVANRKPPVICTNYMSWFPIRVAGQEIGPLVYTFRIINPSDRGVRLLIKVREYRCGEKVEKGRERVERMVPSGRVGDIAIVLLPPRKPGKWEAVIDVFESSIFGIFNRTLVKTSYLPVQVVEPGQFPYRPREANVLGNVFPTYERYEVKTEELLILGVKTVLDFFYIGHQSVGSLLEAPDASIRARLQPGILSRKLGLKRLRMTEEKGEKALRIGWFFTEVTTGSAQFPWFYPGYDRVIVSVILPPEVDVHEGGGWVVKKEDGKQVAMTIVEGADKLHGPGMRGKAERERELRFADAAVGAKEYDITVQVMSLIGPFAKGVKSAQLSEAAISPEAPILLEAEGDLAEAPWIYDYELWSKKPEQAVWYLTNVAQDSMRTTASRARGEEVVNSIGMKFRLIRPGSFMMGSEDGYPWEKPVHKVTLTKAFYMGVYEVTQEEWEKVMGSNPSYFKGPRNPVECVSWEDAQEFIGRLSQREGVTYRLPTDAEWEYTCRAGTTTEFYWGDDPDEQEIGEYAWYYWHNSAMTTHPVGHKKPNTWGLYDMSGNVWEWCEDRILFGGYPDWAIVDPKGDIVGHDRAIRGGDFHWEPKNCRSRFRSGSPPSGSYANIGFRLVRALSETRAGDLDDLPRTTSRPPGDELVLTLPGESGVKLTMRRIPAGSFRMGLPTEQTRREIRSFNIPGPVPVQGPIHEVTLSKPFYMGVYEVTQEQWEAVMGKNPAHFSGNPRHPVESVSWEDVQAFIEKLNAMGLGTFRLPTEAEWEYACRADTTTSFYWGNDPDGGMIAEYAWFDRNSRGSTHPVGQKKPNPWRLYDMSGNVLELCQDYSGDYPSESQTDPTGPESGSDRVARGGCWHYPSGWCRLALRDRHSPSRGYEWYGFRLVREVE